MEQSNQTNNLGGFFGNLNSMLSAMNAVSVNELNKKRNK